MTRVAFNNSRSLFISICLEHNFVGCWNLDALESKSETPLRFWKWCRRRMEKISWIDLVRNWKVWRSVKDRNIVPAVKKEEANWIAHILHGNRLLKHVIGGWIEEGIDVIGRRGRGRKQLLDDPKETRVYWKLKQEALDRTLWRR